MAEKKKTAKSDTKAKTSAKKTTTTKITTAKTSAVAKPKKVVNTAPVYTVDIKKMKIAFLVITAVTSILLSLFITGASVSLDLIAKKASVSCFCYLLPIVIILIGSCMAAYTVAVVEKKQI